MAIRLTFGFGIQFFPTMAFDPLRHVPRAYGILRPNPGIEWRSMDTIKTLVTLAARYRLSGELSGEHNMETNTLEPSVLFQVADTP